MGHMERVTFVQGVFCGVLLSILLAIAFQSGAKVHSAQAKPQAATPVAEHAQADAR